MGSRSSALTGLSMLFPSDDGGILKQVRLTGQLPGPLCPASLIAELAEGGDNWGWLTAGLALPLMSAGSHTPHTREFNKY